MPPIQNIIAPPRRPRLNDGTTPHMKPVPSNWVLILHKGGKRLDSFKLPAGPAILGRESTNAIPLPHTSVSRQHAEITTGPDGVTVRDLDSRNGILVNGVPRKRAALQPGDKITICDFVLELATAAPADTGSSTRPLGLEAAIRVDQTVDQRIRLPDPLHERQLATLYHVCFWIADGVAEAQFIERSLALLLEALRAAEVQFYSADLTLQSFVSDAGKKPSVKLAAFLAKIFQEHSEATAVPGASIARHQRGVGEFNYLVCPLRFGGAAEPAPFLVVLRPADQQDFTADDRVLLQATAQLWTRGLAKTNQLQSLRQENATLKEKLAAPAMIGSSPALARLQEQARKAAATNATILVTGETGSGKEVLAQFIHDHSPRRAGPLVKMNCAAIPDSLIESELFGYAKGAFSGANRDHTGKFVQASGGTLFLDEIGEMPLLVQAKVLRAIENREVQPLGSESTLTVDIRIIAATNKDLRDAVRQRQFREDLYFRLDVQSLRVPPLRDRADDISELAKHFLARFCAENGLADMTFAAPAVTALEEHDWPGNVRELWNVIQRCALNAAGAAITKAEVEEQIRRQG